MNLMDKILERTGLRYDDLTQAEKTTLYGWLDQLQKNKLTLEHVVAHIKAMRDAVEKELTVTTNNSKQDIFLKARLRNYLLLEDLLTSPERAKQAIENAISGIASKSIT